MRKWFFVRMRGATVDAQRPRDSRSGWRLADKCVSLHGWRGRDRTVAFGLPGSEDAHDCKFLPEFRTESFWWRRLRELAIGCLGSLQAECVSGSIPLPGGGLSGVVVHGSSSEEEPDDIII